MSCRASTSRSFQSIRAISAGGTEPLPAGVVDRLLSVVDQSELEAATEEIRRHDVPRVSNDQMTAIGQMLTELGPEVDLAAPGRVRRAPCITNFSQ